MPLLVSAVACVLLGAGCAPSTTPIPMPGQPQVPNAVIPPPPAVTTTAPAAKPPTAIKKPAPKPAAAPAPAPNRTPTFTATQMIPSVTVAAYGSDIHWTMYSNPGFKGYALVKSTIDSNPYYPKQEWFRFENSDVNARAYQDRNLEKGKKTYYRICAINADDSIICGPVASVNF